MEFDNREMTEWVNSHLEDDSFQLRLKYGKTLPWLDTALIQIECRQKARKKLAETLQSPGFVFPTRLSAEQCTSDTLADFHASLIAPGDTVIDLTGGLCIDAFHFARTATQVTVVERDEALTKAAIHNTAALGLENVNVINDDCVDYLKRDDKKFDTAFIDPARRGAAGERVYRLSDCSPDVVALLPAINRISRRLIVKASPMLDITQLLRELPLTATLYITGNNTECKELVADVKFDSRVEEPTITMWTPQYTFSFLPSEERDAVATYGNPEKGVWLYEPGPTLMKAAPFKLLSQRFGLMKLHSNSHLYFSPEPIDNFPGERWHIEEVLDFSSHEIKNLARKYPRINVAVRNFDFTAEKLRKKLGVKDGDGYRLIATTVHDSRKVMLILSR